MLEGAELRVAQVEEPQARLVGLAAVDEHLLKVLHEHVRVLRVRLLVVLPQQSLEREVRVVYVLPNQSAGDVVGEVAQAEDDEAASAGQDAEDLLHQPLPEVVAPAPVPAAVLSPTLGSVESKGRVDDEQL